MSHLDIIKERTEEVYHIEEQRDGDWNWISGPWSNKRRVFEVKGEIADGMKKFPSLSPTRPLRVVKHTTKLTVTLVDEPLTTEQGTPNNGES